MKQTVTVIGCIVLCLFVGFTASQFQMDAIKYWYPLLNKPPLTPPNLVFPVSWTLLYILMGIAGGLLINKRAAREQVVVKLFFLQLVFNFLWSLLFFYYQNPLLGLLDIVILDIVVFVLIKQAYRYNKISFWLLVPYLLWILFATYLNGSIVILN
ncbi:TspO/MBR family protein [Utexia brackfieldae]|uniref:TspO/MBR family protein n=1 Tax=Utexia brackfieldae TaxID=3074108 RepID=UPI00370D5C78